MRKYSAEKMWRTYRVAVESGEISDFGALGLQGIGTRSQAGFAPTHAGSEDEAKEIVAQLVEKWGQYTKDRSGKDNDMDRHDMSDERKMVELGMQFLDAANRSRLDEVKEILDAGFPVNFQHPRHKETALHIAAANNDRDLFNLLADREGCDFLIRDTRGKLAWNNAEFFSRNPELSDEILQKTKEQAKEEGVNLRADHVSYLNRWASQPWYNALSLDDDYSPS